MPDKRFLHKLQHQNDLTDCQFDANLQEAERHLSAINQLGANRDNTVCHALNGLANTKVLRATGERIKPEVSATAVTFFFMVFRWLRT